MTRDLMHTLTLAAAALLSLAGGRTQVPRRAQPAPLFARTERGRVMCDHHWLDDPDGLLCVRTDEHTTGHVYESTTWRPSESASEDY